MEGVRFQVDREITRVLKAQDYDRLAQNANQTKERIEDIQRQLDVLVVELRQGRRRCWHRGWILPPQENIFYDTFSTRALPLIVDFACVLIVF